MTNDVVGVFHWGVYLSRFESFIDRVWIDFPKNNGRVSSLCKNIDYFTLGYNASRTIKLHEDKANKNLIILHPGECRNFKSLTDLRSLENIAKGIISAKGYQVGVIVSEEKLDCNSF